jgi:hypothetical protein
MQYSLALTPEFYKQKNARVIENRCLQQFIGASDLTGN